MASMKQVLIALLKAGLTNNMFIPDEKFSEEIKTIKAGI